MQTPKISGNMEEYLPLGKYLAVRGGKSYYFAKGLRRK